MNNFCVIILAVKKNVAFADDLVKKLDGIPLVQRAIDKAKSVTESSHIFVVTDSEEISTISDRSGVNCYYDKLLKLDSQSLLNCLNVFLLQVSATYESTILLSAYTPLVAADDIINGYAKFVESGCDALVTIKQEAIQMYRARGVNLFKFILHFNKEPVFVESRAFFIIKSRYILDFNGHDITVYPYVLKDNGIEITNYTDWWICEKLLRRRRIVFRVIGDTAVGMGHIFRALTLAHEITDHEIVFVCDERSSIATNTIAGYDYLVKTFPEEEIVDQIIDLQPDMVINDILSTDAAYIRRLRERGIKVVNFEDLGSGSMLSDLTINELYDKPNSSTKPVRWGHNYYFVRDEFATAKAHKFSKDVTGLLITFGGTDQNNYTLSSLRAILDICKNANIKLYVVVGGGYQHAPALQEFIRQADYTNIEYTSATGAISKIMEKTQIAITSNGRTVFELAHMHVPSLVIAQHSREATHSFACHNHGFINLGLYETGTTERMLTEALSRLVHDSDYRKELFDNIKRFNFSQNKQKVVKLILGLLEKAKSDA
ncbi:cytidine 5'-phosphate N-acetylneuraminic acid synthetase [Geobacter sp. DSM 9736]|uniref:cytidine 5'-phosphate N-acetylneuraminic acid synthetase n=1 Tax=Geobacter sp. DSM 9736 TaxID=1277350 RepID=UPI000B505CB7|nr:cytidine 5'-phosphate N-acetylneuraminic acid synthetase [Geobacter sp. DSM 9736]SNB47013.1 Spore coat polysaccharide biosynthesis protein SpsG, predicted glycosyltransferase [Geobacter sp. DSM 9736]